VGKAKGREGFQNCYRGTKYDEPGTPDAERELGNNLPEAVGNGGCSARP
jgi:hypothetical protein